MGQWDEGQLNIVAFSTFIVVIKIIDLLRSLNTQSTTPTSRHLWHTKTNCNQGNAYISPLRKALVRLYINVHVRTYMDPTSCVLWALYKH